MSFEKPTREQLRAVADDLGIDLSDDELAGYLDRMEGFARAYALVDEAPDPLPGVGHRRSPGRRPRPAENRYNAWFVKASIREEYRGRLAGKTLAVKDSICVAGLPMMNGASFLEGTVADVDATVVTRALHAGAEIVGKTNCEYLSLSGGSHTCANGPVIIDKGLSYQQEIDNAIERCRRIVAILSPDYFMSPECTEELMMARLRNKRADRGVLLPVYWRGLDGDLALWLRALNYSDCREEDTAKLADAARHEGPHA